MKTQLKVTALLVAAVISFQLITQTTQVSAKKALKETPVETTTVTAPQPFLLTRTRFRVINMMPNAQSNETAQDSEPNIAVDPANVNNMIGSAFTRNPTGATDLAPIYASTDRGATWTMRNIIPSSNGGTHDISVKFASRGHTLYAGILRGGFDLRMNILRSADPFGGGAMTQLVSRDNVDQPFLNSLTSIVSGNERDRVFVGNNDLSGPNGRTATVDDSASARTAAAPAGFANTVIEVRTTNGQDRPSVRAAAHSDGRVYGLFGRTTASNGVNRTVDVTVVRDNNHATNANPFRDLVGAGGNSGVLVATGVNMPFINDVALGQQRLGSHMSIAVDPSNSARVIIAWTDRPGTTGTSLHVRRSTDSGATWSADLLTVANGVNPALAINSDGLMGCLYQQLVAGRWETHFRRSSTGTTWSDVILSNTPDNTPAVIFQPYLGDYTDLMSVGRNFYGVFSANNAPILANFPQGVTYQRNANFTTNRLRNLANTANVAVSIDPFFFAAEQVPIVFDNCLLRSSGCPVVQFEPERIKITCINEPCLVVDPVPRNCLVKFDCPGCGGGNVLCPPYYHMFIDKIDPDQWQVTVAHGKGELIPFELNRTETGIVISFRPTREKFKEKTIGDYKIYFHAEKLGGQRNYEFPTRLEVSDYRFAEHMKYGRQ